MFHVMLTWLEARDIVMLDTAICDLLLRPVFLSSLRLLEYSDLLSSNATAKWVDGYFSWSVVRELKFVKLTVRTENQCIRFGESMRTRKICLRNLQSLDISRDDPNTNRTGILVTRESFLAEALVHVPGLQSLNISDSNIGATGASSLAEALVHGPGLQNLSISRNRTRVLYFS